MGPGKKIAAWLAYAAVTLYALTWRYKMKNREVYDDLRRNGKKVVMAIWHDQLLPCSFLHRNEGMTTIASDSKDGELITFGLEKWGFRIARGSSTRGGVKAALNAIKISRAYETSCAVTVDGPKGPRHIVKTGAVFIAKKLDRVILVGLIHAKRAFRFGSWDRFVLPMPFSSIYVTYSEPFYVSEDVSEESVLKDTEKLQKIMTETTREASPLFI